MKKTNQHKAVIFDLDGVLVDSGEFHKQSWYDLAAKEGFSLTDEFFYSTFGMQNYQIIPQMLGTDVTPDEIERLSVLKEQRFRELVADKLTLLDGVPELIEKLKSSGFLLAVGSSAPWVNLDFMLRQVEIDSCFDVLVCGDEITHSKPAPDTFLKAAEKLSVSPDRCVVVEDAVQGVEAAIAAGMATVAVTTTRSRQELDRADIIVDSMTELNADSFEKLLPL
ncbi:MAG: HAD family phosphatase [Sedimentisphaerales bacterium]|nr:HAD family phosphatase [Sedimentisphaerales bacterium]